MKNKCASFFSGVGGIDIAFESSGFEIVYANEIDKNAVKTFEQNFKLKVDNRDIKRVKSEEIPQFEVLIAGFPCQAFSVAGKREGFDDKEGRGTLYFELSRIIRKRLPKVVFLENVKNLVGHDGGNTFRVICEDLEEIGYKIKFKVLNAKEYGNIPQNRERIYMIAFRYKKHYNKFEFPSPQLLKLKIEDVIDYDNKVDDKYYYSNKNCFYEVLQENMYANKSVYQWRRKYVRENKSGVCPTLTANMGTGGHNVPLIKTDNGIRKLTPRECFKLQGFPDTYKLPEDMSDSQLYKQAGNSVVVPVIMRISKILNEIIE